VRGRFVARPKSGEGVGCFIVLSEDMMKFETIKLHRKIFYILIVCCHAGVMAVQLPHDLVDDELRVTVDVKLLDPELGSDAEAVDEGLILCHIVCCAEMQSNHIKELAPGDFEGAILWIQLNVEPPEVVEGFLYVGDDVAALSILYHDVIDMDIEIAPNFLFEAKLHTPLVCSPCVL
jgi:hypothetical protein